MSTRDALRVYALALPPGAVLPVPRELLLELLAGDVPQATVPARDLSVEELARHFGRSPNTVRAWLERGDFEGAYKLRGRAWRVPPAAVQTFTARQREGPSKKATPHGQVTDLGAWRKLA